MKTNAVNAGPAGPAAAFMRSTRVASLAAFLLLLCGSASAWDNHKNLTHLALQSYEGWETPTYEPIEKVLPALSVAGAKAPVTIEEFGRQLQIRGEKMRWKWVPGETPENQQPENMTISALEILLGSVDEPDWGMDQELNVTPDQKYMGGFTGFSSQGFRHMFFGEWRPFSPQATFHIPTHELGQAPVRAALFFELAKQAKSKNHDFWAWRFLGIGLHYVQDVSQPYHSSQLPSLGLMAIWTLITQGWDKGVAETTRIVANYHLAFEHYTDYLLDPKRETDLATAFKVPAGNEQLKLLLEHSADLPLRAGVVKISEASADIAGEIVGAEKEVFGEKLVAPGVDLRLDDKDDQWLALLDFNGVEKNPDLEKARTELRSVMYKGLSNLGVATRWYVDRFKSHKNE